MIRQQQPPPLCQTATEVKPMVVVALLFLAKESNMHEGVKAEVKWKNSGVAEELVEQKDSEAKERREKKGALRVMDTEQKKKKPPTKIIKKRTGREEKEKEVKKNTALLPLSAVPFSCRLVAPQIS